MCNIVQKWPHGGSSQSVAKLQRCVTTLKLNGTDGQAGRQAGRQTDRQDHVLSQADALTKKELVDNHFLTFPL